MVLVSTGQHGILVLVTNEMKGYPSINTLHERIKTEHGSLDVAHWLAQGAA